MDRYREQRILGSPELVVHDALKPAKSIWWTGHGQIE